MGLVKTRRLAAMRKQTTYAKATVVKQRAKAGTEVLPMWECCRFQCRQFPVGDWEGILTTRATFSRQWMRPGWVGRWE